jgi:hypothetical protein
MKNNICADTKMAVTGDSSYATPVMTPVMVAVLVVATVAACIDIVSTIATDSTDVSEEGSLDRVSPLLVLTHPSTAFYTCVGV